MTVPACSALMNCTGVQIREVGWRPRNNLASADTKPGPSDPAGLHGGCTESGLISGTRPNELITGLSFQALPATFPPSAGGGVPCICLQSRAGPGAGEGCGAPGANSGDNRRWPVRVEGPSLPGVLCLGFSASALVVQLRSPLQPTLACPCCGIGSLLKLLRWLPPAERRERVEYEQE